MRHKSKNVIGQRRTWWAAALAPSLHADASIMTGHGEATAQQPPTVGPLVASARYPTVVSWITYPFFYIIKNAHFLSKGNLAII